MKLPENEPILPIRTAARLLNISVHTLRMYEREGLIIPFKKKSSHRLYSKSDLERLECIRATINKSKISINGIKAIYSLIPCWKIKGCESDPATCKVLSEKSEPCWNVKTKRSKCSKQNCRTCEVYINYATCNAIKDKINLLLA